MNDPLVLLGHWETFYVIVGGGAAALTGLQFVVMALIAERRPTTTTSQISAFGTPSVVHFSTALFVSALLVAPWPALTGPAVVLGLVGAAGVFYVAIVAHRASKQQGYELVMEDWIWHVALPFLSYALVLAGAIEMFAHEAFALFMVGAAAALLLFIGIHNAWDTVTFVTLAESTTTDPKAPSSPPLPV